MVRTTPAMSRSGTGGLGTSGPLRSFLLGFGEGTELGGWQPALRYRHALVELFDLGPSATAAQ